MKSRGGKAGSGGLSPVPFTRVAIEDGFWAPRIEVNRRETLDSQYKQLVETGRVDAFKLSWKPGMAKKPHVFWDSDTAKWVEAASYSLATHPDGGLARRVGDLASLIVSAQQPDGYLNSYFTGVEPDRRWTNLRDLHELYCAGHLIEAAVAHFQATDERELLDALRRYADHIAGVFGTGRGKKRGYCGHEEIELALVKLYRATGERKYLGLARYFIEERGRKPSYFEREARERGDDGPAPAELSYYQAHAPVRQQTRVTGHAVRAMYLYSAMADIAYETGDRTLFEACSRLWEHATGSLMYVTGGIGSSRHNEGFAADHDLPNETAYCETCAAIGLVFWAHRMLRFGCDSRYADVMERALYNAILSGVSLDGRRFFYENPLASSGRHHRQGWYRCACCPPNIARLLASLGGYAYSEGDGQCAVHLYAAGAARLDIGGREVVLRQETDYPWDGRVRVTVEADRPTRFRLMLRRPGWCSKAQLAVNGVRAAAPLRNGYFVLNRMWESGDAVELDLDMPVRRVYADPRVRSDCARTAIQRGPVIYCIEGADNGSDLETLSLPREPGFKTRFERDFLGGVVTISARANRIEVARWGSELYRGRPPRVRGGSLKAVPYCVWDNREAGEMLVWIRQNG